MRYCQDCGSWDYCKEHYPFSYYLFLFCSFASYSYRVFQVLRRYRYIHTTESAIPLSSSSSLNNMKKGVAIDVNDLEAQFLNNKASKIKTKSPAFIVGDDFDFDEEIVEFNDTEAAPVVEIPKKTFKTAANSSNVSVSVSNANPSPSQPIAMNKKISYASATVTVEELEANLVSTGISPKLPATAIVSQVIGSGPPPGLPPGLTNNHGRTVDTLSSSLNVTSILLAPIMSNLGSSAPSSLQRNDPNKEFMNRFERNLIMKIHTTQLTTETPLMEDFYYQALAKKKKSETGTAGPNGQLLYFPLPSAAERQKELQRRERRKKLREKEQKEKETENVPSTLNNLKEAEISADLVLGKVSHSTSRKPRQQLKVPSNLTESTATDKSSFSLHEKVVMGIEEVYSAIISIEDFYLSQEEIEDNINNISSNNNDNNRGNNNDNLDALVQRANEVIMQELNLGEKGPNNNVFIHFLTIPKGRAIISRVLQVLRSEGKGKFLENLVEYFDFMEIVRPETSLLVIDSFISQVLSPLVAFVGEANWSLVISSLTTLFGKRSFVWIALTKTGMVLLCILLSRLEILKGLDAESHCEVDSAGLTEKIYDSLEGHLLELFSLSDPSRDFYAWQFLALLAMNVESDRKRSMILELRDKILVVVEAAEEKGVRDLNVFLNALGLDASQLK